MPARDLIKTWYRSGNPLLAPIAAALNRLGVWANTFDAARPLYADPVPGGVKLRFSPWESPFIHPWRVSLQSGAALIDVAGGVVNTGAALVSVTGLTGVTPADGLKIWLAVKYYNNPATANLIALAHGTSAWPASSYSADTLPAGSPLTLPMAGWSTTILPVAEIIGNTLHQYLYSDVLLEKGLTHTTVELLGFRENGYLLEAIFAPVTYIRGVRTLISTPTPTTVLESDNCPEP